MDNQFCKASRSVRAKRHRARVKILSERLVDRYLTNIEKSLPTGERNDLISSMMETIVKATKDNVAEIVSSKASEAMSDEDRIAWMAKRLE